MVVDSKPHIILKYHKLEILLIFTLKYEPYRHRYR